LVGNCIFIFICIILFSCVFVFSWRMFKLDFFLFFFIQPVKFLKIISDVPDIWSWFDISKRNLISGENLLSGTSLNSNTNTFEIKLGVCDQTILYLHLNLFLIIYSSRNIKIIYSLICRQLAVCVLHCTVQCTYFN